MRVLRGRYDAVQTTSENSRHWANADGMSAAAANSSEVRRIFRNRCRYEIASNPYARGVVETFAYDTVGTGPRLQLTIGDDEDARRLDTAIEAAFAQWANAVRLAEKLRTMRKAKLGDGEAFAIIGTNPTLPTPAQLDLRLVEADQIAAPFFVPSAEAQVDGISFDAYGNPTEYELLERHPGAAGGGWTDRSRKIAAQFVLHWFRQDRPGQERGIPEIASALPLFAQLRRYTLAVIASAEAAADIALVLEQSSPPPDDSEQEVRPFSEIEFEPRMATALPYGMKLSQTEPGQAVQGYAEVKKEILKEIFRCLCAPFGVAAGDFSDSNYASGRLDDQIYLKAINVERSQLESAVVDRLFIAWLDEMRRVRGSVIDGLPDGVPPHRWFWDGREHVDPVKEANAQETRLLNHTTTLAEEYAKRGLDWEVELRQSAKEKALMKDLGLEQPGTRAAPDAPADGAPQPEAEAKRQYRSGAPILNGRVHA